MRQSVLLIGCVLLAGCGGRSYTATVIPEATITTPEEAEIPTGSGTLFVGKFSTTSAINSKRSFVSDYHGEIRMTVHPSRKIECHFWSEGRITDPSVYEGNNGFISSFSTLCIGKLQKDGSMEFQGAYIEKSPIESEDIERTFTLRAQKADDTISGVLVMNGAFANATVIDAPDEFIEANDGVRFRVVTVPLEE